MSVAPGAGAEAGQVGPRRARGLEAFRDVMRADPPEAATPFAEASLDVVYGDIWTRPGLGRRERRFVTLACVAAADARRPIERHVRAALVSGDVSFDEMLETVLHFAVYCGWPKASVFEAIVWDQWRQIHEEQGVVPPEPTRLPGPRDYPSPEARRRGGAREFVDVNRTPAAPPEISPYKTAGILDFVFGEVWQRPGLARRERRFLTMACCALDDAQVPIDAHVYAALASGDIGHTEMQEVVLHFAAYYGWAKAARLAESVRRQQARIEGEAGDG